jgi:hypothetical protein
VAIWSGGETAVSASRSAVTSGESRNWIRGTTALALLGTTVALGIVSVTAEIPEYPEGADAQLRPAVVAAVTGGLAVMALPVWHKRWRLAAGICLGLAIWIVLWVVAVSRGGFGIND